LQTGHFSHEKLPPSRWSCVIAVISDCSASASDPQARQIPVHFFLSGGVFCFVIFMVIQATLNKSWMATAVQLSG
jgi:hypothetical protein